MVYSIKNTRNTEIASIPNSVLTTTAFGIQIPGKNYTNYGEAVGQDLLHILENFACPNNGSDAPNPANTNVNLASPVTGQLWYDTTNSKLRVYNGTDWEISSGAATPDTVAPSTPSEGDIWYNTTTNQLLAYNGTAWIITTAMGDPTDLVFNAAMKINAGGTGGLASGDGAAPSGGTTTDASGVWMNNILTGIWSVAAVASPTYYYIELNDGSGNVRYYSFTPYASQIEIGLNIESGAGDYFNGKVKLADEASALAGVTVSTLLRNDNGAGADTSRLPSVGTLDIGSSGSRWQTVYATTFNGTSTSAQYADVAERYEIDEPTEVGMLVKIGGMREITVTRDAFDLNVFGVISENPALRMNEDAGDDSSHPFIAFSGRLSVYVVGEVTKGQRLVASSIAGVAMAASDTQAQENVLSIIGRALEDKASDEVGKIEVVVGAK